MDDKIKDSKIEGKTDANLPSPKGGRSSASSETDAADSASLEREAASSRVNAPREQPKRARSINPLGMRVVVKIRHDENMTNSGLYLPEGAKESKQESLFGEVLEVASAIDDETDEEANISGIPLGALVLIPRDAGLRVPWDDDLRIVDTEDVLALVEEVELN